MNSINFFYNQANQNKPVLDKFINWALSWGRAIVMITEVIALVAFLYRFNLDSRLVDLHDSIKQNEVRVANSAADEAKFRNLQNRLLVISTIDNQAKQMTKNLMDVINQAKGNVTFVNISYSATSLVLQIVTPSTQTLDTFVNSLRDSKYIDSVSLTSVTSVPQSHQIKAMLAITVIDTGSSL